MKCPKCQYLGFETGDRCKNCGYDFSLVDFRTAGRDEPYAFDAPLHAPGPSPEVGGDERPGLALPLFALTAEEQPLVTLPPTPRRPLAVRRAADTRTPSQPRERRLFDGDVEPQAPMSFGGPTPSRVAIPPSSLGRRCLAAGIDLSLLCGIDVAIVYFTVRMAGLDMSDWRLLPLVPLMLFLGVLALAYESVFTAIGGQTIGKMATRIRVVSEDAVPVGAARAAKRTAGLLVSALTGGLGYVPAFVGEHRALHDRLSRTRVVDVL